MTSCYPKEEYDRFVTDNHPLVYSFLNSRRLEENEFYDVVVFGFLKAADEYLSKPELRQMYKFSTIARVKMRDAVRKYYEKQMRRKRIAPMISLDAQIYGGDEVLSLHEVLSVPDSREMDFETELLMLELASKVSKRDMRVIRMKTDGYGVREIAKAQRMSMRGVGELLAGLRDVVLSVCNA